MTRGLSRRVVPGVVVSRNFVHDRVWLRIGIMIVVVIKRRRIYALAGIARFRVSLVDIHRIGLEGTIFIENWSHQFGWYSWRGRRCT